jgi:hypothetical protein
LCKLLSPPPPKKKKELQFLNEKENFPTEKISNHFFGGGRNLSTTAIQQGQQSIYLPTVME